MRLTRAACACAAAVASLTLTLAPAAPAFRHPSPRGRCRLNLNAPRPWQITAGEPLLIAGQLACRHEQRAAGQVVRLFQRLRGAQPGPGGFAFVASTTTNAQGEYQFQLPAGAVDSNRVFHVRAHGAESANRGVRVAALVKLEGPPEGTQLLTGRANAVEFKGTVSPADVGARVILQRQNADNGNEWHAIGRSSFVTGGGTFVLVHRFLIPGDANLRVVVHSQGRNVPSASNVLTYEISQAQKPGITIESSADPIAYGQAATIKGKVAAGGEQKVTLLAHTVHDQAGFAPVAQAAANAQGEYTFPAQSPTNSTFYKVRAEGPTNAVRFTPVSSAVLFEGVRYVLTAQVSTTSVQQGQVVTFSGSIAPAPSVPNHILYIEHQGPDGEFHVVHVGYATGSQFSIPYQPYVVGAQVFRVRIPGGPSNGSAVSQLFTIQVARAAPGTLAPEAPGNTSEPPLG
jgi:hypothetical protein